MGYDLNIVRQSDWSDAEGKSNITYQEWLEYVAHDNELVASTTDPDYYEWINYPHIEENGLPWFVYSHDFGFISTKNPDQWVIEKMIAIAEALYARVQGEQGEFYDEDFLEQFE
jgi:hypothetical protein